jgi:hypothetical protein
MRKIWIWQREILYWSHKYNYLKHAGAAHFSNSKGKQKVNRWFIKSSFVLINVDIQVLGWVTFRENSVNNQKMAHVQHGTAHIRRRKSVPTHFNQAQDT